MKFFSDPDWMLTDRKFVVMLHPFRSTEPYDSDGPDVGRFNDYFEEARHIFFEVSPEAADVFLFPHEYAREDDVDEKLRNALEMGKNFGKKLLLFYNADDDRPIQGDGLIIFRTSFYASTAAANEFSIPGWSADFADAYFSGKPPLIAYSLTPSVSYCGYVDYVQLSWKQRLRNFSVRNKPLAEVLRGRAVRALKSKRDVQCSFMIRNGFWAAGEHDKQKARDEYAANMAGAGYALVCRGGGNFSYRLYEAMSLGRIPVFIDTDCVLPFTDDIHWDEFMVRIPVQQVDQIGAKLLAFHRKLSADDFMKLQHSIRSVYTDYISPRGFFYNLAVKLSNHE
jgi:hypothetical protein